MALATLFPHWLLWGPPDVSKLSVATAGAYAALFLAVGIVVHEALHGVGYWWGGADWSEVEFGFNWAGLAPYAHCTAPLRCRAYRWAVALPGLALGAVPLAVGLITGHWGTALLSFAMLSAASGDALLLWMVRDVEAAAWVQDHPTKMGALVLGHPAAAKAPELAPSLGGPAEETETGRGPTLRWGLVILAVFFAGGLVAGYLATVL